MNGADQRAISFPAISSHEQKDSIDRHTVIFATFAENAEQLSHASILAESIRTFAGRYRDSPIWIYLPEGRSGLKEQKLAQFADLKVELRESQAPSQAVWFYYARKVFAAAQAEALAEGLADILAWMDEDTVVLQEPGDFNLEQGKCLAYRPVMHKNIGSLYAHPPDSFWTRLYEKLSLPEGAIFPMITPADGDTIRSYFNAGLLVVRPERGILRQWAEYFPVLYTDPVLVEMCQQDVYKRIFLHQTALVGAILNLVAGDEMVELTLQYNFPLFFKEMFGAKREFDSVEDVVTLRYDVYFRNPAPDWSQKLKGPEHIIAWLRARLGHE